MQVQSKIDNVVIIQTQGVQKPTFLYSKISAEWNIILLQHSLNNSSKRNTKIPKKSKPDDQLNLLS